MMIPITRPAALMGLVAMLGSGCATAPAGPPGSPVADPDSLESAILAAAPVSARQATFAWRLDEAGSAVRGTGVVRYEAPHRIRLDLFGPRGETYLIAALVDDELRLPPGAAGGFDLPSPSLLWAALGVVRPPTGGQLEQAALGDGTATLGYSTPEAERHEITVRLGSESLVTRVERIGRSGVLETVHVEYSDSDEPVRTTYVDRRTYRELVLERESVRDVESFPASIWRPDAPGGNR